MIDLEVQGFPHRFDQIANPDRQQTFAQPACDDAVDEVAQAIESQQPHPGEMPEQAFGAQLPRRMKLRKCRPLMMTESL